MYSTVMFRCIDIHLNMYVYIDLCLCICNNFVCVSVLNKTFSILSIRLDDFVNVFETFLLFCLKDIVYGSMLRTQINILIRFYKISLH